MSRVRSNTWQLDIFCTSYRNGRPSFDQEWVNKLYRQPIKPKQNLCLAKQMWFSHSSRLLWLLPYYRTSWVHSAHLAGKMLNKRSTILYIQCSTIKSKFRSLCYISQKCGFLPSLQGLQCRKTMSKPLEAGQGSEVNTSLSVAKTNMVLQVLAYVQPVLFVYLDIAFLHSLALAQMLNTVLRCTGLRVITCSW